MASVENNAGMSEISAIIEKYLHTRQPHTVKSDNSDTEELSKTLPQSLGDEQNLADNDTLKLNFPSEDNINEALNNIIEDNLHSEKLSSSEIVEAVNNGVSQDMVLKYLSAENGYLNPLKTSSFNFIDIEI